MKEQSISITVNDAEVEFKIKSLLGIYYLTKYLVDEDKFGNRSLIALSKPEIFYSAKEINDTYSERLNGQTVNI